MTSFLFLSVPLLTTGPGKPTDLVSENFGRGNANPLQVTDISKESAASNAENSKIVADEQNLEKMISTETTISPQQPLVVQNVAQVQPQNIAQDAQQPEMVVSAPDQTQSQDNINPQPSAIQYYGNAEIPAVDAASSDDNIFENANADSRVRVLLCFLFFERSAVWKVHPGH